MTKYVVFEKEAGAPTGASGGGHWVERGEVEAASSKAAVAAYLKKSESEGGTFAAVPARSFVPMTVETQTRAVFK